LQYGAYLAGKFSAVLRVFSVVDVRLFDWTLTSGGESFVPVIPSVEFQTESRHMQKDKTSRTLEKAGQMLAAAGIAHELLESSGIPADEICHQAMENDLLVMGVRGEYERWGKNLLGETVESAIRQTPKPILLVDKKFEAFGNIQIGYDGSVAANRALQLAGDFGSKMNLPLSVLCIYENEEQRKEKLNEAGRLLEPYRIKVQLRHESGEAGDVLVRTSQETPGRSLTVIGSFGHSRLREAILGSTTIHVLRRAGKPILMVN
jgi:nucleotide-binding universal stress UspA family protein